MNSSQKEFIEYTNGFELTGESTIEEKYDWFIHYSRFLEDKNKKHIDDMVEQLVCVLAMIESNKHLKDCRIREVYTKIISKGYTNQRKPQTEAEQIKDFDKYMGKAIQGDE